MKHPNVGYSEFITYSYIQACNHIQDWGDLINNSNYVTLVVVTTDEVSIV